MFEHIIEEAPNTCWNKLTCETRNDINKFLETGAPAAVETFKTNQDALKVFHRYTALIRNTGIKKCKIVKRGMSVYLVRV